MSKKQEGQYMTPPDIVKLILDNVGYEGERILKQSIFEPSFGDGAFLAEIISRIISEGRKARLSRGDISRAIGKNVYGIEKDRQLYDKAIARINALCKAENIPAVKTDNLICGDTLLLYKQFEEKMDFCVGNPPFIRIHNIPAEYRKVLADFRFAKGTTDLYIIFYEIGLFVLKDKSKLGFITPNSFMRNSSQRDFRRFVIARRYLAKLFDFKSSKLFEDADTYTCIGIFDTDRARKCNTVEYREYSGRELKRTSRIDYSFFETRPKGRTWDLSSEDDMKFVETNNKLSAKLGDIANVQNGIATLRDNLYVVKAYTDKGLTKPYRRSHADMDMIVYIPQGDKTYPIESSRLRHCVKASKYDGTEDNTYIIYPYVKGTETLSEKELKEQYPCTYAYFCAYKDELLKRKSDASAEWFAYGRSQGLIDADTPKIVFKHIVSKDKPLVIPYIVDKDVLVYSGIYASVKKSYKGENNDILLNKIKDILASEDFGKYCSVVGKDMGGDYACVSTTLIKQFGINDCLD